MNKTVKIVIGSILMMFGVLYLLVMFALALEERDNVRYHLETYLNAEYQGGEYLGKSAVTDWGCDLEERDGYVYYCLDFQMENLSSEEYYNPPASVFSFWSDYSADWTYEGKDRDYEKLFCDAVRPKLPGKSSALARIYVQVREGTEKITACYHPNFEEDEIEIPISLEEMQKKPEPRDFDFSPESVPRAYM